MHEIDPGILAITEETAAWRRDFHAHPEVLYDVHRTAGLVAERLRGFGCDEVVTGIGRTGVVGVIRGRKSASGKVVALRADMDALPISEKTNLPHASTVPGKMHACGHDGHTAMLLGAARHLAATRDFDGTLVVVFQPAEEGGAGARAMIEDGLVSRFGIREFYGMHTMPGLPLGAFATRPGAIMAATVYFDVTIEARGAHAAQPHKGIDPVLIAAHAITALQAIPARATDPLKSLVISVTRIDAGEALNVIPDSARLRGTIRFLDAEVGRETEERFRAVLDHTAKMFGASATIDYRYGYPVTLNHAAETAFAVETARQVATAPVDEDLPPTMGGEDFSFMLQQRPGAFVFIGNGDTAPLHNPGFDFDDRAIPYGIAYWSAITRRAMPM
jgi:hippurate hydrolase